jgi:glutathione S-transferase
VTSDCISANFRARTFAAWAYCAAVPVLEQQNKRRRGAGLAKLTLAIANKNYSSWSLRAWMAMRECGIPFEEKVIPLDTPQTARNIARHSGAGRLPVLHHGDVTVWESLAILEYLAELFPAKAMWPKPRPARAVARAVANEMHAGFQALRNACPMNLRRPHKPLAAGLSNDVRANIARIETLWKECRKRHGKGGPFLFGTFSIADAMYAPVAARFETYAIPVSASSRAYMDALFDTQSFRSWKADALREKWIVAADEAE